MPHLSLLAKFSVVTLLCVVALGAALAFVLRDRIEERAAADARELAVQTADDIADNHLTPANVQSGLTTREEAALTATVQTLVLRGTVADAKLYDRYGGLVYALREGDEEERSDEAVRSAAGETVAHFEENEDEGGRVYEVYVPLRFVGSDRPSGAFELYLPYAPIAEQISEDTRALYPVLIGGLALLYLVLVPIVARASRRLRRLAAESRHQALHDELTGLPNRRRLMEELEAATRAAGRSGSRIALLALDLDRFKDVNDALGHSHGDHLLREVADCLRRTLRAGDTLARLGGDEFGVLARDVAGPGEALALADRIASGLHREFVIADVPVVVEASVGIALYPDHGGNAEDLLRAADTAMYAAKQAGTRRELYVEARDKRGPDRIARLSELRHGLAHGEIEVHYQPKVDLRTGTVTGTEALARWAHPRDGLVGPGEFIPLAEQTGLIASLTSHVLEQALSQCRDWALEGLDMTVAVNVSERSLLDTSFPDEVQALIERHGIARDRLQLELTERSLIGDLATAMDVIARLHALGVRLSVDDFGTGFSSLSRLVVLPLQELKIDRSFVMDIDDDGPGAAVVRSTIDLGHHLGLEVVAEGVETETTLAELRELGCDAAQGFHVLPPLPPAEVGAWLRERVAGRARA